jgi:DNA primase small subunit
MAKRPAEAEENTKRPADEGPVVTPELMKVYYDKVFPCATMYRWLSYKDSPAEGKDYFARREFSMTLPGDIYVRYKSYDDYESFRRAINDMQPEKIDIGAVFSFPPKMHKMSLGREFVPTERELVFDIDMDDYDDIRTSGSGKMMSKGCWTFMAAAVTCLNRILRDDFGFEHIFFVFSGRRGMHCWICDERARELENEVRSAICAYCSYVQGTNDAAQKVTLYHAKKGKRPHPAETRAILLCKQALTRQGGILDTQDFLKPGSKKLSKILGLLTPEQQTKLAALDEGEWTSRQVWDKLTEVVGENSKLQNELALEFAWPRLDVNVTKQMNHLLKAPFCIHPKTGNVCVTIDPEDPYAFDPTKVPTLRQLVAALDEGKPSPLEPYVQQFKRFIQKHHVAIGTARREASEAAMDF